MISSFNSTPTKPKLALLSIPVYFTLCFLIPFVVYVLTLAPTVYTFDSAEFATGAFCLGIIHPTGYPFYLVLAKLFTFLPFGDVAYRVNMMSAVFGGFAIALLFITCQQLTKNLSVAAGAGLVLAFSRFYWREAVIAETYTLNAALLLCVLLLITSDAPLRTGGAAALVGLFLGLGLANHMSTILLFPALLFWLVVKRVPVRRLALIGMFTLVGLLFYLYLPIRYLEHPPLDYASTYLMTDLASFTGLWSWITGETFRQFMLGYSIPDLAGESLTYLGWLWTNFVGAGVLVGIVGLAAMFRQDRARFVFFGLVYAGYTVFFINYRVVNKDTMFLVSYLIWTIWIAYGGNSVARWLAEKRYPTLAAPAFLGCIALVSILANYASVDQSHNTMARDYAGQLLDKVAPSAFIVTEWTWATPLEYLQIVEQQRPDVTIYDRGLAGLGIWSQLRRQGVPDELAIQKIEESLASTIAREISSRPVYATEYDENLATRFEFISLGRYYRLRARPVIGMLFVP